MMKKTICKSEKYLFAKDGFNMIKGFLLKL